MTVIVCFKHAGGDLGTREDERRGEQLEEWMDPPVVPRVGDVVALFEPMSGRTWRVRTRLVHKDGRVLCHVEATGHST